MTLISINEAFITGIKMADKKYLVIVESPTKAKTIRKFLPSNYTVEASMGHVRDLPQSATDIPAALKKEEWTKLGVNVDEDFAPLYVVPKDKKKIIYLWSYLQV